MVVHPLGAGGLVRALMDLVNPALLPRLPLQASEPRPNDRATSPESQTVGPSVGELMEILTRPSLPEASFDRASRTEDLGILVQPERDQEY